jgi:hypothetical protein
MKKFIALALVTLGITGSARAQWIVFDPTMNVQSILNTAQEVAKFVEMINNQVQQIQTLTDQLNEFKHYESLLRSERSARDGSTARHRPSQGGTVEPDRARGAVDAGEAMLWRQRPVHQHRRRSTRPTGRT